MFRLAALALLVDGVFQIAGQSPVWPTLVDRSVRDQTLFVAHVLAGLTLAVSAALLNARTPPTSVARQMAIAALTGAFVIASVETTWFNYPGTIIRGVYTIAVSAMCARAHVSLTR